MPTNKPIEPIRGYKGIPGFTRRSQEKLLHAAENSVYFWWWQFLKLSPALWYAHQTGLKPANSSVAKTHELAGNLYKLSFPQWWQKHGRYLFAEARDYPKVREIDVDHFQGHELYGNSIVLEIPLDITRKKAMAEIRKQLVQNNQGQMTQVLERSTATFKLHTKRFHPSTLENEFWVLVYKVLYPEITNWKLCQRLQLAPHIEASAISLRKETGRYVGGDPIAMMQSLVGRNLYKARFARHHAERGTFPCYTKVDLKNVPTPFGLKHHSEYLDATEESKSEYSAWQSYLHEDHWDLLRYRILDKNRLNQQYIRNREFKANFPQYMSGKDLEL